MTGHHHNCKPKIEYYDKVWICECQTCHKKESEESEEKQDD